MRIRMAFALLAFAAAGAQAQTPPASAPAASSQPSEAEQLVFMREHLAAQRQPRVLRYSYVADAAGQPQVTDRAVLTLANDRYEGGVATYLDVITAQQGLLNNERLSAQLQGQRLLTTVFLIKALGGDWQPNADVDAKVAADTPPR